MEKKLKLLLIEDNESDAALTIRALQKAGINIQHERVEKPEELKNALQTKQWDFVISDYQLPDFNAPIAFDIFKSFKIDIPFIVLSGSIGEEAAVAIMKKGVHDYVLKQNMTKLPVVVQRELSDATSRREIAKMQEDLILSNAALESSLRTKDEFLILASHELKTPLTALKLRIQFMQKKYLEENKPINEIDFFSRQVDRIIKVIEDMIDVTRIQSGIFTLELSKVNLNSLVENVLDHFSVQLKASQCRVNVNMTTNIEGQWDRTRLLQVIINIIDNVIKYAPGSNLNISANQDQNNTYFTIHDSGPGIPKEKQRLIFNRFERLGVDTNVSGLGLGLYICKKVIDALGGTIVLESDMNKGTTFQIKLPNDSHKFEVIPSSEFAQQL